MAGSTGGSSSGAGRDDDYDALFADIVSRWEDTPTSDPTAADATERPRLDPGTAQPDDAATPVESAPHVDPALPEPTPPAQTPQFGEPVAWRVHEVPEDELDEHFEPSAPRPLPSFYEDWPFYLALVGLVAGPLWLLYLVSFASTERSQMWMAGALTVAGFVTVVLRQPHQRDIDESDDGARV